MSALPDLSFSSRMRGLLYPNVFHYCFFQEAIDELHMESHIMGEGLSKSCQSTMANLLNDHHFRQASSEVV